MKFTKVSPPVYYIYDNVLNEYEVRLLMAEIAEKKRRPRKPIVVQDMLGNSSTIEKDGRLSNNLHGFDFCTMQMLRVLKIDKLNKIK